MITVCLMRRQGRSFWECQWTDPVTGRKRTRSTGTALRKKAEQFRARLEVDLECDPAKVKAATWEQFVTALCLENLDHRSASHRRRVLVALRLFEKAVRPSSVSVVGDDQIADFTAWVRRQKRDGVRKTAETTLKSHLGCLRLALKFAVRRKFLRAMPQFEMPKGTDKPKGRPITREELERMISHLPPLVGQENVKGWTFLLDGLWWSGLRIGEALRLHWCDDRQLTVKLDGKRPVFKIAARTDKGRQARTFPMAPGFARLLLAVPDKDRDGLVFRTVGLKGRIMGAQQVERVIAQLGKKANVVVADGKTASAHDLRRAFATRWAMRVKPAVLQQMMRHKSIATTMSFYADLDAQDIASEIWDNDADGNRPTNTSANTSEKSDKSRRKAMS